MFEPELYEEIVGRQTAARGKIIRYENMTVRLPNGSESARDIVRHPGGCVIVPIDGDGFLYLVRQYRVAFETVTLEFPAGKLEGGEAPETCAERELLEETGFRAGALRRVLSTYSSPGFCDEIIHVFLAERLAAGAAAPDEDEFVKLEKRTLGELLDMMWAGEIRDAKTVIGILLADRERGLGGR
ncbi:MAG: NUDIX hydrolase [Clostridiales bacterium]|jgi:ADP-ribose pyrophosphatase|nr:NUDIX hydrolase [Clostridiales bacterium]